MRVLHIESGRYLYGGAQQVAYLLPALDRVATQSGRSITSFLAAAPDAAVTAELPQHTVFPMAPQSDVDIAAVLRLRNLIWRQGIDLVHCHSRRGADLFGGLAAALASVPCVLSRRVDNPERRWFVAAKYALFDRVITISDGIARVLANGGVAEDKIRSVRSAVDVARFDKPCQTGRLSGLFGFPEDARVLGIAAQLIERKGHDLLFDALPELLERWPKLHLLVLGKGPLEAALTARANLPPLLGRVHMVGFRTDLPDILPNLTALVHPAYTEGLGVALLQAASAGIPVIATRAGGIPEAVVHQETGLLSEPGDVDGLRDNIAAVLEAPNLAMRLGAAGKARMYREFSIEVMARGNFDVYCELLDR